jgi:ribonuclease BN (tRNA processing enzyme)
MMRAVVLWLSICIACLSLLGCAHKIQHFYPEILAGSAPVAVTLDKTPSERVSITYLGCGNLVLEQNGVSIMTDPFFSNQKVLALSGKIRTKDELYRLWKGRLESSTARSAVRAVLVSHTHYDHVMDLPTLLHDHYFQNLEVVYGNRYMPKMLSNFKKEGPWLDSLTKKVVYDPTVTNDPEMEWVAITPQLRFLAIKSDHAPHRGKTLYMSEPLTEGYFEENLTWPNDKISASRWTAGDSYSFLVDFIQKDTLRVFIQTSASNHPNGLPPKAELAKKKVDLAIMCYASAPNVEDYPNKWVEWMKPKKLVLVHWEDFFRDARSDDDHKLVRGTKPSIVRQRIDQLGMKRDFFIMPLPGTRMDFAY